MDRRSMDSHKSESNIYICALLDFAVLDFALLYFALLRCSVLYTETGRLVNALCFHDILCLSMALHIVFQPEIHLDDNIT